MASGQELTAFSGQVTGTRRGGGQLLKGVIVLNISEVILEKSLVGANNVNR